MSAQADELLRELARRMGAWRAWFVRATVDDVIRVVGEASGATVERVEALGGSPLRVADVRALGRSLGREALLACDSSLATSSLCAPCKLGANVGIESLDLTLGRSGSGLIAVGVARWCPGRPAVAEALDALASRADHAPRLWEPALVSARLEGLDERMHAACDLAQALASFLSCHPRVSLVSYPGLLGDASYEAAASNLHHGFGPFVDYLPVGSANWQRLDCLSLGGTELPAIVSRLEDGLS